MLSIFFEVQRVAIFGLLLILANSTIMRSYSSAATTLKERTAVMANLSAYQGVGFILGPRKPFNIVIESSLIGQLLL